MGEAKLAFTDNLIHVMDLHIPYLSQVVTTLLNIFS